MENSIEFDNLRDQRTSNRARWSNNYMKMIGLSARDRLNLTRSTYRTDCLTKFLGIQESLEEALVGFEKRGEQLYFTHAGNYEPEHEVTPEQARAIIFEYILDVPPKPSLKVPRALTRDEYFQKKHEAFLARKRPSRRPSPRPGM